MQIDKQQILDLLRSRGEHETADHALNELPGLVDTDKHGPKLDQLGIDTDQLYRQSSD